MNLKQLATHLGLSQTTVSRALNGYPEVNRDTRERVQRAASEHGYSPNRRARSLATGRSMAIGHVIPLRTQHEMMNPVFADFIAGAGETYSRNGYDLILSVVGPRDEEAVYSELFSKGAVDGVIVHGPRAGDNRIEMLNRIGLPFVVHGRASDTPGPYSWLDINNRRAFDRATGYLIDLGHRRIALLNGLEDMDFAQRRRQGFLDAHQRRGIEPDTALMCSGEMTEMYGYEALRPLLASSERPTALLCSSMISAVGARRAIHEAGLELARDISLITHDDDLSYLRNGSNVPMFTATKSSVREAGRTCAEMILRSLSSPDLPLQTTMLEAEFVLGQSTGPAPASL
ncbi:transcriptional regulator, LacI family [Poseidonocella pacifica]|uniref:Transcriptional regulator, LacI family n=1 Tax=Poseidonocella pacifica TaxID=871651 RepID=A0A1I0V141_9RHOB|nr:substrate-binding domain-containing protein [Poseidonocella pacifica]SFA70035.1 transcriptional regulator, LacI family [Poseidonocella pacifica]